MKNTKTVTTPEIKNYKKFGIIATLVVVIAILGSWLLYKTQHTNVSVESAISNVSSDAINAANLRIAIVRMDAIHTESNALKSLRKQKESYETRLRDELTKEQKALEKEKTEIEKSQDVLSREALQRRVTDYQRRVANLQRDVTERAQSIEMSYQKALADIQNKHLDPILEGIIAKKQLSLVIDGRFAKTGANIENLDISNDVIQALNKRISTVNMDKPKGF